jgi:galactose-3-O-sulfotransferase
MSSQPIRNRPIEHVIFIHIPKAAGRTMHSIVARQYDPGEVLSIEGRLGQAEASSLRRAEEVKAVIGLVYYGFHQYLQGASTYVTMLREPVSRVLSLHRYIATNPNHHLYEHVRHMSLTDFVSGHIDVEEVENGQTRQIAGVKKGSPDTSSLERAKHNLETAFAAVGLVDRFDESVVLFKRRLGWKLPLYVPKNVTKVEGVGEASTQALDIIRSRNRLDTELYEFGRGLFGELVRREGRLFHVEVSVFQALNALAGTYWSTREFWRRLKRPADST